MKWIRLLICMFVLAFAASCSVHVGPNDSTHHRSKHKKHKTKKPKKHKAQPKKPRNTAPKADSGADDPPPPADDSGSKLTSSIRGKIPAWVVDSEGGKTMVRPEPSKDKQAVKDLQRIAPEKTQPSGALRIAPMKAGQTTVVTYDLKAGDCTGFVVRGDRGIKDLAAVLTEGKGNRMRVIAKDDPDGNEAVLNRGGCISIGNQKKSVTLHVLVESGNGKVSIQRFRR